MMSPLAVVSEICKTVWERTKSVLNLKDPLKVFLGFFFPHTFLVLGNHFSGLIYQKEITLLREPNKIIWLNNQTHVFITYNTKDISKTIEFKYKG